MRLASGLTVLADVGCRAGWRRVGPDVRSLRVRQQSAGPARAPFAQALHRRARRLAPVLQVHHSLLRVLSGSRRIQRRGPRCSRSRPEDLDEIRIGFLAPLYDHPDQVLGNRMLNGATMAIDEANAAGGYGGKPFRLVTHNDYDNWQISKSAAVGASKDSAIWGAASNDAVRMIYDDKVWAMFGSISSESTHIALRLTLKAETPLVNSASTDPTIPETIIPWYFTDLQDDRVQGYTLARHIYTELGLKRVAILRVNDRYGRFGVLKFRDASRRLGHPVVIEQKFMRGDTDFRRQLQVIEDSRVDAIVLWTDIGPAAMILQQMQELGMKQRVFGSHRTIGDELVKLAGPAAEGFEAVFPYDPNRTDPRWLEFNARYEARFHEKPDHFAALAYDADANPARRDLPRRLEQGPHPRCADRHGTATRALPATWSSIRTARTSLRCFSLTCTTEPSTTGASRWKSPTPAWARTASSTRGRQLPDENASNLQIGVFGPHADEVVRSPEIVRLLSAFNAARQAPLADCDSIRNFVGQGLQRSGEGGLSGSRAGADCARPPLQSSRRTDCGEVVRPRRRHFFRPRAHLHQHPLDLPPAGGHSSAAGFAQPVRCDRPGWTQPGRHPGVTGLRQIPGWRTLPVDRRTRQVERHGVWPHGRTGI